jgi:hypothetical protein
MVEESKNTNCYSQHDKLDSRPSFRNSVQHEFMGVSDGVAAKLIYLARSE